MKEKRYFCDWMRSLNNKWSSLNTLVCVIAIISIFAVTSVIFYFVEKYVNVDDREVYCEGVYQYLEDIANMVISEDRKIDINQFPEDVCEYSISYKNDMIELQYSLDNDKWKTGKTLASMTIILSEDFEILKKTSNYASSEQEHEEMIANGLVIVSILDGMVIGLIICAVVILGSIIAYEISETHKKYELKVAESYDEDDQEDNLE